MVRLYSLSFASLAVTSWGLVMFQKEKPSSIAHSSSTKGHKNASVETPLYWVHVPKCACSLINPLIHVPDVCNMDPNYYIADHAPILFDWNTGDKVMAPFEVSAECPGAYVEEDGQTFADHSGIGAQYDDSMKGHGIIMLRQPEQRIISGYNDQYHSWPLDAKGQLPTDLKEYAEAVEGCTVKMLMRDTVSIGYGYDGSACGDPDPVTPQETFRAVQRLREGFAFVGLTEQFDLSVCLFRKQFGGDCLATDFYEIPPQDCAQSGYDFCLTDDEKIQKSSEDSSLYDTSGLGDWTDGADGAVYEEGVKMFEEACEEYDVSYDSCAACFSQAGYTPTSTS